LGIVQVSATWLPVRSAARSVTGSGKLSEGGSGVPGVPQPAVISAATSPAGRAPHPILDKGFIALPVYWTRAGVGTQGAIALSALDESLAKIHSQMQSQHFDRRCASISPSHGAIQLSVDRLNQLARHKGELDPHRAPGRFQCVQVDH
jgi:hypothetical protein